MIVNKWGHSLAVRLPKQLVDALDLKDGDQVELRYVPAEKVFNVYKHLSPEMALRQLREQTVTKALQAEEGDSDA